MSLPRIALVMLVIGTAITASYFIAINPIKINNKPQAVVVNKLVQIPDPQPNLLSTKTPLEVTSENSITNVTAQEPGVSTPRNVTEQIISTISDYLVGQIITENTNGPTLGEDGKSGITVPTEKDISDFVNQNIGSITDQSQQTNSENATHHPKVYEVKLVILHNPSRSEKIAYLKNLIQIGGQYAATIKRSDSDILGDIMNQGDSFGATQLSAMYGAVAHAYSGLAVPKKWQETHKEILSYYFTAQAIWADIANYKNDPMQALAAIEALDILHTAAKGIPQLIHNEMAEEGIKESDSR